MMTSQQTFALCARALGALFYYPPDSPQAAPLVEAFRHGEWQASWPLPDATLEPLAAGFSQPSPEPLTAAFQRLFIGPDALPAPPWGSVWLDRESVLFGDSTLALRQWMREEKILFASEQNEPEDHIGTLLLLAAWLAENERAGACEQLLAWHILPWSTRFLTVFSEQAAHPFYASLGQLARLTLADWQRQLLMPVADKPLYR